MAKISDKLPPGWWIIPLAPFGAAAWVGVIHLMISLTAWAHSWGAMP